MVGDRQTGNNGRSFGFLRPKERAYLSERGYYFGDVSTDPPAKPMKTKSDIQTELAAPNAFRELVKQFEEDLGALQVLQYYEGREAKDRWERTTLRRAEEDLRQLQKTVDIMLGIIERGARTESREELRQAWLTLGDGLEHAHKALKGYREFDRASMSESDVEELVEKSNKERDEWNNRDALFFELLERESNPFDVLEELDKRGRCRLRGRQGGDGETKGSIASRDLVGNGLATRDEYDYFELTERGRVVLQCWNHLVRTPRVQNQLVVSGDGPQKVVKRELEEHSLGPD